MLEEPRTWLNLPLLDKHQKKKLIFVGQEDLKYSGDQRSIISISHFVLHDMMMTSFFEIITKACKVKPEPNVAFHFTIFWAKRVNYAFNRIDRENLRKL